MDSESRGGGGRGRRAQHQESDAGRGILHGGGRPAEAGGRRGPRFTRRSVYGGQVDDDGDGGSVDRPIFSPVVPSSSNDRRAAAAARRSGRGRDARAGYDYEDEFDDRDYEDYYPEEDDGTQTRASMGILLFLLLVALALNNGGSARGGELTAWEKLLRLPSQLVDSSIDMAVYTVPGFSKYIEPRVRPNKKKPDEPEQQQQQEEEEEEIVRPDFVYEHPYVTSSYYTSTRSLETLLANEDVQVKKNLRREAAAEAGDEGPEMKTRLAIVRPFCEFDAEALPTTFTCWNSLTPCKAASGDIGDDYDYEVDMNGELVMTRNNTKGFELLAEGDRHLFDLVGSDAMKSAKADLFLFYSQTFSENMVAIKAVDEILNSFFEPGGWSQCVDNIYAIEANIPQELDLYIPSAQEELYSWVNGPNRQFEAAFRIIQSGEWGDFDGFYLMEGDSVPIKSHWLDVVLSEIEVNRPFAILGAQYDGDKWDNFYEQIPISLLHHTNGNAIYNTSHPLLERLVGQLEVEAPCPYNSIPYDYRMSQMWVEGTLGIVPELAPKIMLNEEGQNITLSDNIEMFKKWADIWEREDPFKYTPVIHNYAATNLIPRHLGPEYIIHGAKLYSPWDPTRTSVTLVISEWFFDRSLHLIEALDDKDHPFSEVIVMVPPAIGAHDDYAEMTEVPIRTQHRGAPDFMDLCEAEVDTDWFMITNSVSRHVDLMFTPGKFVPVVPFTPATYAFCLKFPYCKETINLAQRIFPGASKVVLDMDMLYHTESRNKFCREWKEQNGDEGEDLYKNQKRRLAFRKKIIGPPGPTGTAYLAWLMKNGLDKMYKLTDRSLYGARPPFVKVFSKEEKLDGMSEEELAKRVGMTLIDNATDCNCGAIETEEECYGSGIGCIWRPLFESCHPPELIDGDEPICSTTESPTMSPTLSMEPTVAPTDAPAPKSIESPTQPPQADSWFTSMFKSREHEAKTSETDANLQDDGLYEDDDAVEEDLDGTSRKLSAVTDDPLYNSGMIGNQSQSLNWFAIRDGERLGDPLPAQRCDAWDPSIVPRKPTKSTNWIGPSIDSRSRSFHAMSTSRPRKLKGSLILQYHRLIAQSSSADSPDLETTLSSILAETPNPMEETTPVAINLPKYALREEDSGTSPTVVNLPDPSEINSRKTLVSYLDDEEKVPLKISFCADHLLDFAKRPSKRDGTKTMAVLSKVETLTGDILPSVSEIWAAALSLSPSSDNLFPVSEKCGEAMVPKHHLEHGIPDVDLVVYVTVDGQRCSDGGDRFVSGSTICSFDQFMRPLSANIELCTTNIEDEAGGITEIESIRLASTITQEVGRILGLNPSLFRYFRNLDDGKMYGSTERTVTCVDETEQTVHVPNVLQSSLERSGGSREEPHFLLTTPTVRQVLRNHFDCQSLNGARLDRSSSTTCFGDFLDLRYFFDEDMTLFGGTADSAFSLTPLSLALLEDSGWYRANFEMSTVPLFGRGAGCGFVHGNCVGAAETVPDYSKGFFCNDANLEQEDLFAERVPSGCDYTYNHKADCSRVSGEDDTCPMRTSNIQPCSVAGLTSGLTGEVFSENSHCFVTNTSKAVCLESYCNEFDAKIDIVVNERVFQCDYEGQILSHGQNYLIECPRLAVFCPHLACPSNCSGRGVCDYCQGVPRCICDDPFDESPGCDGDMSTGRRNAHVEM